MVGTWFPYQKQGTNTKPIRLSHVNIQNIPCAIFEADAADGANASRARLLDDFAGRLRIAGYPVAKRALCYYRGRQVNYFGDPDLVRYLASTRGTPPWNGTLN